MTLIKKYNPTCFMRAIGLLEEKHHYSHGITHSITCLLGPCGSLWSASFRIPSGILPKEWIHCKSLLYKKVFNNSSADKCFACFFDFQIHSPNPSYSKMKRKKTHIYWELTKCHPRLFTWVISEPSTYCLPIFIQIPTENILQSTP